MDYQSLKTRHHNERNRPPPQPRLTCPSSPELAQSWISRKYGENSAFADKRVDHDAIRRTSFVR